MNKRTIVALFPFTFFFFLISSASAEVKFLPLVNADLMGGQSFFKGETSSFGGHCSLDLVPALRLREGTYLLPRYSVAYVGSSLAIEIEDESYLYQQIMDHALSLKLLKKKDNGGVFKLSGGYMMEYLRETRDEKWGHGLYDYGSPYGEVELGKEFEDKAMQLFSFGYRYYGMSFPNYESLASKLGLDLSGQDVIDSDNHKIFVLTDILTKQDVFVRLGYDFLLTGYRDQKVELSTGEFSGEKRKDKSNRIECTFGYDLPAKRLGSMSGGQTMNSYLELVLAFKTKRSNQNYLDPEAIDYIEGYYDYNRFDVKPSITYKFSPLGLAVALGYRFTARLHPNRFAQDIEGFFTDKKLRSWTHEVGLKVSYDIRYGISAAAAGGYSSVKSNNSYEVLYTYNYESAHYLAGLSYEY